MRLNLTFRQSGELASEDRPFVLSITQLGEHESINVQQASL